MTVNAEAIAAGSSALEQAGILAAHECRELTLAILTAAAPIIEAHAKAEALREAADDMPEWPLIGLEGEYDGNDHHRVWLRARAETIEGKSE